MSVRSKTNREGAPPAEPERDGSELPEGWAVVGLSQVVDFKKGKKPTELRNEPAEGFVPYLDIQAIQEGNIRQFADVASSRLSEPSDVLVVWDGARSGLVGMAEAGAVGSTIMALTTKGIDARYLRHFIASQYDTINSNTRGTGIPHVDPEVFWNLSIPIAPLAEQRRIVGKLELLLGKVSSSQQRLSRVPGLLKRFRQSVLAAACSGKLTADWREENPEEDAEWLHVRADEVCEAVQSGSTPKAELFQAKEGVPFLKVFNIVNQAVAFEYRPQFVSEETHRTTLKRASALPGDVLMNIVGPPLGKVAIVPNTYPKWSINQAIALFRPRPQLDRQFLYYLLCSGVPYAEILSETRGSAGQSNISLSQCREMLLPLPPLAEQQEIVRRVEKLFALADQIEARLKQAQTHVDRITQSLLAKAFRGELVPTEHALATREGRDYESADELLVRIRATQASASPAKPKRGKTSKT